MSRLQRQNSHKSEARHDSDKLSLVLPKMQTGNHDKCKTSEYLNYQSASRLVAEPIAYERIVVIGFFYCKNKCKANN